MGRVAQRRSARREADRTSFGRGLRRLAPVHPEDLRTSRCGLLWLGGGASLRKRPSALYHGGPQDLASAGATARCPLEALAQDWMPMSSANSGTNPRAGAKRTVLSPCAIRRRRRRQKNTSSISCSTAQSTTIACL